MFDSSYSDIFDLPSTIRVEELGDVGSSESRSDR
jgi:hypothetical protein